MDLLSEFTSSSHGGLYSAHRVVSVPHGIPRSIVDTAIRLKALGFGQLPWIWPLNQAELGYPPKRI